MKAHLLRRFLVVVMIGLGVSSNAWGQSAIVRVGDEWSCSRNPGFYVLNVSLGAAGPVATASFKVVASSPVAFISPPNGEFDVSFNPCVVIGNCGQLVVSVPAGPAVTFSLVAATGHANIEVIDCDGYPLPTAQECEMARLAGPYRPTPPDGAIGVPTDQLLDYVGEATYVVIATSPDFANQTVICASGDSFCALPLNPGPLAPNTTYYWQATNSCVCGQVAPGHSQVFTFSTGDAPIAVEATTWGRVKAMYRE